MDTTALALADVAHRLLTAQFQPVGQFADASNLTLLIEAPDEAAPDGFFRAVYKPASGARPLHDFDADSLAAREVLAYQLSGVLGWDCIPTTVWREDLDFGPGSVQEFIPQDDAEQAGDVIDIDPKAPTPPEDMLIAITGTDDRDAPVAVVHWDDETLRKLALFDVIVNHADRKVGHILRQEQRWVGIDNGLAFHDEWKLRTVLWGWAGQSLTDDEIDALAHARAVIKTGLPSLFSEVLSGAELRALESRCTQLLESRRLPELERSRRCIPWPVF